MSILISKLVPDPIVLLSLELEELGGILLVHLNSYDARESNAIVQLGRVSLGGHLKTGQSGSLQNRPVERIQDSYIFTSSVI
ncbi:MAG: hypothetical protein WBQ65_19885, partial [Bryobacteraceae bacterium]